MCHRQRKSRSVLALYGGAENYLVVGCHAPSQAPRKWLARGGLDASFQRSGIKPSRAF
ncbi:MAG: hypothetical protein SGJ17_12820 [Hyphomicrobiales bacterium]|nr:hypothetical protein [Hyphomicrobiales bacterium]